MYRYCIIRYFTIGKNTRTTYLSMCFVCEQQEFVCENGVGVWVKNKKML